MNKVQRRGTTRSSLFLVELMIGILFFAVAAAVCVQLFVKAHLISTRSRELSMAVVQVQTAAEYFQHSKGDVQLLVQRLGAREEKGALIVEYNDIWEQVSQEEHAYSLVVRIQAQGDLTNAWIAVEKQGAQQAVYALETVLYKPQAETT